MDTEALAWLDGGLIRASKEASVHRSVLRSLAVTLGLVASLLVSPTAVPAAVVIHVTTTVDQFGGGPSACSLREAIQAVNTGAAFGGCLTGDRIRVPAGTFTLTREGPNEDDNETGDLDVRTSLTLVGAGSGRTIIGGNGLDRVLDIGLGEAGIEVSLRTLTIRDGDSGGQGGGGLRTAGVGTIVTLDRAVVSDNHTDSDGGGILNGSGVLLTAAHTTIARNRAESEGGGMQNRGSSGLRWTTLRGNTAGSDSGAIENFGAGANLTLVESTVSGNRAPGSAGIENYETLTLHNSTVSGNVATGSAGGIRNLSGGTVSLNNATIAANRAGSTGGLQVDSGTASLTASLIGDNEGGDCGGAVSPSSNGGNLDSDGSCNLAAPADRPGAKPGLLPLRDNGGPTRTHALRERSRARGLAPAAICFGQDQRGAPRKGSQCDAGAYQYVTCRGVVVNGVGTPGKDRIVGTKKADGVLALGGNDVIRTRGGDDAVCAGPGRDRVYGGPGDDTLHGGAGNDLLVGGPGNDLLIGGPGRDTCRGGPGRDRYRSCERRL